MGEIIARLHNGAIIHGDLTTSNFMVKNDNEKLIIVKSTSFFNLFST